MANIITEAQALGAGFLSYRDIVQAVADPKDDWRIEGVIPRGITLLVGSPGLGKSLLSNAWGFHVAAGASWFGRRVRQGAVVYLCPELGISEFAKRLHACRAVFSPEPSDDPMFAVRLQNERPFILNMERRTSLTTDTDSLLSFLEAHSIRDGLLIIDPLADHFVGDENGSTDMGAFVGSLRAIRAARADVDILVVHHTTKIGTEERGHTALRGAVDLILRLTSGLKLKALKNRGEPVRPIQLKKQTLDLRAAFPDQFRGPDPVTSAVMLVGNSEIVRIGQRSEAPRNAEQMINALRCLPRFPHGLLATEWERESGIPATTLRRNAEGRWSKSVERLDDKRYVLTREGSMLLATFDQPVANHQPLKGVLVVAADLDGDSIKRRDNRATNESEPTSHVDAGTRIVKERG